MYVPEAFAERDRGQLVDFIRETGWGCLVGWLDGAPFATHLPFLTEGPAGKERLVAHVARANPHWRSFAGDGQVQEQEQLVVFSGPHAYVSPRWYASAQAVPTWNYAAVHAYGVPRIVADPDAVRAAQKKLVDLHEASAAPAWRMEDLEAGYLESMLRAIVCFEIPITRIEGKFKLSQNRPPEDRAGVIRALSASPIEADRSVSALMAARETGPAEVGGG